MNIVLWAIKAIVIIAVVAAAAFAHVQLRNVSGQVQYLEAGLGDRPQQVQEIANLRAELTARQADIDRIHRYVVTRPELVEVINRIEQEAVQAGVEAQVTDVKEVLDPDTNEPFPGPIQDINLQVTARGDAASLLQFLYQVEHMPFLTSVASWRLGDGQGSRASSPSAPTGPDGGEVVLGQQALTASVIIAIKQEE